MVGSASNFPEINYSRSVRRYRARFIRVDKQHNDNKIQYVSKAGKSRTFRMLERSRTFLPS